MKIFILIVTVILLSGLFSVLAFWGERGEAEEESNPLSSAQINERNGSFFRQVDDMLIEVEERTGALSVRPKSARLWENGVIPVRFDDTFSDFDKKFFFEACSMWTDLANVKCKLHEKEDDYIFVLSSTSNSSFVGRIGGAQTLNLLNRRSRGIIAHELAHALGFQHQHNSPERNQHVEILWDNIASGKQHNFTKVSNAKIMGKYDYCSIMHYSPISFSKNGQPTLSIKKETDCNIGQRFYLSTGDKLGMIEAYGPSGTGDSLIEIPDFFKTRWSSDKPSQIFTDTGLKVEVIARMRGGERVDEFISYDSCNTECRDSVSSQFPAPTSRSGVQAPFGAIISLTVTRECEPLVIDKEEPCVNGIRR